MLELRRCASHEGSQTKEVCRPRRFTNEGDAQGGNEVAPHHKGGSSHTKARRHEGGREGRPLMKEVCRPRRFTHEGGV